MMPEELTLEEAIEWAEEQARKWRRHPDPVPYMYQRYEMLAAAARGYYNGSRSTGDYSRTIIDSQRQIMTMLTTLLAAADSAAVPDPDPPAAPPVDAPNDPAVEDVPADNTPASEPVYEAPDDPATSPAEPVPTDPTTDAPAA